MSESKVPSTTSSSSSSSTSSSSVAPTINPKTFWLRLGSLYDSWRKGGKLWGGIPVVGGQNNQIGAPVDALLFSYGPSNEEDEDEYSKNIAIQLWLFGYEVNDTVLLFTREPDTLIILTSQKKSKVLDVLGKNNDANTLKLQILLANKVDKNAENINKIVKALKASKTGKRAGFILEKESEGKTLSTLQSSLSSAVKKSQIEMVDIGTGLSGVLAVKDAAARALITSASEYNVRVLKKFLIPKMESIIDDGKQVGQITLADETEDVLKDPKKVESSLSANDMEACYSPIIQSGSGGDKFDLKPSAVTTASPLAYDPGTTIIIQTGARYKNYCSNVGRTFFINPNEEQKAAYGVLLDAMVAARKNLKHGVKISAVYTAALKAVTEAKNPDLVAAFTKNCGFGMGLEFRESSYVLNDKNPRVITRGMCFNLCLGFQDLVTKTSRGGVPAGKLYAVLISDTYLVAGEGEPETLTKLPRELSDVAYSISDETEEKSAPVEEDFGDNRKTRGVGKDSVRAESEADKARTEHQAALALQKREDALKRLALSDIDSKFNNDEKAQANLIAYKDPSKFPVTARRDRIHVDVGAESVLLPINDQLVPFHVNCIKQAYKSQEGNTHILRLTFHIPETEASRQKSTYVPNQKYVSEVTYRSNTAGLDKVFFEIKELRKRILNRAKEIEAKSSIKEQPALALDRSSRPTLLKDLSVRPPLSRKKTTGTLSAHLNGFRFVTTDKIRVDIIYKNIKGAFYQPAEDSHHVLLHFELKDPILLDKTKTTKKTNFLQFFVEVVEVSEDLSTTNRYRDEDGLAEEQEERRRKKKWNERFLTFVKEVEDKLSKNDDPDSRMEFDIPYRELSFTGVPGKQQVNIMPTVHSLVALDDAPPFVLTLEDVAIANFERIQFGLKNFDLVFVFNDFNKLPMRIEAIPVKQFEPIKSWLNSCNILFYESPQNILWKHVMKQITKDPEAFWQDGGFDIFLSHSAENYSDPESESEEEEEEEGEEGQAKKPKKKKNVEESESEFDPGSDEEDASDDSEEYETDSEEESGSGDDESASGDDDDDDEEGEDWDELEEKAKKMDKEKSLKAQMKGEELDSDEVSSDDERKAPPKKKNRN